MNTVTFHVMSFFLKSLKKPDMISHILSEIPVESGSVVLDYACGPGLFTIPLAEIVGSKGMVYAADRVPTAQKYIEKKTRSNRISNIKFILTDGQLPIADKSVDTIILFDCIHMLENRQKVFEELFRVLKNEGQLVVDVHHISEEKTRQKVEEYGLFQLQNSKNVNEDHAAMLLFYNKRL